MALRAIWEQENYFYAFQNRLDVSEGNFEKMSKWIRGSIFPKLPEKFM